MDYVGLKGIIMMTQNLQNVCDLSLPKVNQIIMKGKFTYRYMYLLRDRRAMIRYRVIRILSHFSDIDIHICINYCLRVRRSAGIEHIHIISD